MVHLWDDGRKHESPDRGQGSASRGGAKSAVCLPGTAVETNEAGRSPPHPVYCLSENYWSRRRTFWSDCEASDRALVERLWRVCRASRLAASSLESARV